MSGDTEETFTFSATDDTVDDDGEQVKLTLGTLPGGVFEGSYAESVITINDDDDPSVTVSFGQSTYTVNEGDTVEVTVTLSAAPERTVEMEITAANQDGATTDDYSGVPARVTFGANETSKTFTVAAAQDNMEDTGEKVKITFESPLPHGVSGGIIQESVISIVNDDQAALTDATLRDLTLTDPNGASIVLTPTFDPLVDTYQASVSNDVVTTSVAATKNQGDATLEFVDRVGAVQTGDTSEIEYSLDIGDNLVGIKVTSAGGNEVKTYTVTVKASGLVRRHSELV